MNECEILHVEEHEDASEKDPEAVLEQVERELKQVIQQIQILQGRKQRLTSRRDKIKDSIQQQKSAILSQRDWDRKDFPWSEELENKLQSVFGISRLRAHQLPTINATMSKVDAILIMPTGGGKSLCYQLPALISKGITLVVSPLVSLIEDQLMGLKELGVEARKLNASSTREEVNAVHFAMTDAKSPLKLLYVTPEKLAKSKRFMSKLQKMHEMGRFARLAIDEVHCCSQWGHDFRPDYKFLGIMRKMFPGTPILGLTATATSRVVNDVQKILDIQGCLILKASFNRPNLIYQVRPKSSSQKECNDEFQNLLEGEFRGQSGIIYTMTIKDAEELAKDLRARGIKVAPYHAQLEPEARTQIHRRWVENKYQVVVATIAFGMGIDKPDVRFVIHHCISKSMENFYQESGRAGRDGKPAKCIVFWRFADLSRQSTMVFTEQTGLENLYGLISYCIDSHRCRRNMIAEHFDERWEASDCMGMCDHCREPREKKKVDLTKYGQQLVDILTNAASLKERLTGPKLVDVLLGKGPTKLRVKGPAEKELNRERAENLVAFLLIDGFLKEDFHFTPYSTISYIVAGPKAEAGIAPSPMVIAGIRKVISDPKGPSLDLKGVEKTTKDLSQKSEQSVKETKGESESKSSKSKVSRSNNKERASGTNNHTSKSSSSKTSTTKREPSESHKSSSNTSAKRKRTPKDSDSGSDSDFNVNFELNSSDSEGPSTSKRNRVITIDSSEDGED
ncbi:ATP-dependent DNA helicase Q1-like [Penaeus japonicus]|uniref:ATP-dependent DNA helicase Q1-like n=1 Tax=Penaeus japonicus TaxID=27405 RepID=UPI001C713A16|nr:ATP-dependent DNA helicase Q1-like [Penaeus japonicus]